MKRFWEIDTARGIAIILMIIFHIFRDLKYFSVFSFESIGFWWLFPRIIASMFIFLVGISLYISYSRTKNKNFRKYLKRGLKIFSWGLAITLVTWALAPENFVFFGILHFIGIAVILAYPFLKNPKYNLIFGMAAVLTGWYLSSFMLSFPYLMPLGLLGKGIKTFDYFPIFPWFGLVLTGMWFGELFYPGGKRDFKIKDLENIPVNFLSFVGRHSLKIYLIHQPVIITIVYLISSVF